MSDRMADEVKEEQEKQKTDEQLAADAQQKRLWVVSIVHDPETGQLMIQPNENVTKGWQLDMLIERASKQLTLGSTVKAMGDFLMKVSAVPPMNRAERRASGQFKK